MILCRREYYSLQADRKEGKEELGCPEEVKK
jgi:hypothetical protein